MKTPHSLVLSLSALILVSCSSGKENENADTADSALVAPADTAPVAAATKFKFNFVIANIPSPASTMDELGTWGVSYNSAILNDPKKAQSYTTEFQKSINLGVYNIDMAYAMVNDRGDDVMLYMKSISTLGDELGLKGVVDAMVGKRIESNLNNRDSLFKILDEIFVRSDSYLRTNKRVYTAAMVFAGSWLENFYLTCKLNELSSDIQLSEKARKQLWEQRFYLGNLINLLNDYKDRKECADLVNTLKPIHTEIAAIKQPVDFTGEKLNDISAKIITLRNQLTK